MERRFNIVHPVARNADAGIADSPPRSRHDEVRKPASHSSFGWKRLKRHESLNTTSTLIRAPDCASLRTLRSSDMPAQSLYSLEGRAQTKFTDLHLWQASSEWTSRKVWPFTWGGSSIPLSARVLLSYRNLPAGRPALLALLSRYRYETKPALLVNEGHTGHLVGVVALQRPDPSKRAWKRPPAREGRLAGFCRTAVLLAPALLCIQRHLFARTGTVGCAEAPGVLLSMASSRPGPRQPGRGESVSPRADYAERLVRCLLSLLKPLIGEEAFHEWSLQGLDCADMPRTTQRHEVITLASSAPAGWLNGVRWLRSR